MFCCVFSFVFNSDDLLLCCYMELSSFQCVLFLVDVQYLIVFCGLISRLWPQSAFKLSGARLCVCLWMKLLNLLSPQVSSCLHPGSIRSVPAGQLSFILRQAACRDDFYCSLNVKSQTEISEPLLHSLRCVGGDAAAAAARQLQTINIIVSPNTCSVFSRGDPATVTSPQNEKNKNKKSIKVDG